MVDKMELCLELPRREVAGLGAENSDLAAIKPATAMSVDDGSFSMEASFVEPVTMVVTITLSLLAKQIVEH